MGALGKEDNKKQTSLCSFFSAPPLATAAAAARGSIKTKSQVKTGGPLEANVIDATSNGKETAGRKRARNDGMMDDGDANESNQQYSTQSKTTVQPGEDELTTIGSASDKSPITEEEAMATKGMQKKGRPCLRQTEENEGQTQLIAEQSGLQQKSTSRHEDDQKWGDKGDVNEEEEAEDDDEEEEDDEESDRDADGLTSIERLRLERIKENQAFLAALGLNSIKASALLEQQDKDKSKKKHKPQKREPRPPSIPVRRSTRSRRPPLGGQAPYVAEGSLAAGAAMEDPGEEQEKEEIDYDDSRVFKYICSYQEDTQSRGTFGVSAENSGGSSSLSSSASSSKILKGFTYPSGWEEQALHDQALSAIYSLQFQSRQSALLAAAGKQGRIAIFQAKKGESPDGPSEEEKKTSDASGLLMSFRAHGGWVADVRFVQGDQGAASSPSASASAPILLVSAGNDGFIKLWDLSRAARGVPKAIASCKGLHGKGIFSLDEANGCVAIGSKDASITLLHVTSTGLDVSRHFEDLQDSVIKCVRFSHGRQSHLLALGGDDREIKVLDLRTASVGTTIPQAHARTLHSIRWHPTDDHQMLTAGLDPYLRLWDLRKTSEPLKSYFGHVSSLVKQQTVITSPEFYDKGRYILVSGEKSGRLSIYDTITGQPVSRGQLATDISQFTACGKTEDCDDDGSILVADRQGRIINLKPFYE